MSGTLQAGGVTGSATITFRNLLDSGTVTHDSVLKVLSYSVDVDWVEAYLLKKRLVCLRTCFACCAAVAVADCFKPSRLRSRLFAFAHPCFDPCLQHTRIYSYCMYNVSSSDALIWTASSHGPPLAQQLLDSLMYAVLPMCCTARLYLYAHEPLFMMTCSSNRISKESIP
jgi:hypothetical protein